MARKPSLSNMPLQTTPARTHLPGPVTWNPTPVRHNLRYAYVYVYGPLMSQSPQSLRRFSITRPLFRQLSGAIAVINIVSSVLVTVFDLILLTLFNWI